MVWYNDGTQWVYGVSISFYIIWCSSGAYFGTRKHQITITSQWSSLELYHDHAFKIEISHTTKLPCLAGQCITYEYHFAGSISSIFTLLTSYILDGYRITKHNREIVRRVFLPLIVYSLIPFLKKYPITG